MGVRVNGNGKNHGLCTQRDVAELFGITQGRVYQIEQSALRKIRQAILADPRLRDIAIEVCGSEAVEEAAKRKDPLYL